MIRLNIVVEGQTEETFVLSVLAPHLAAHGVFATARSVVTSRNRAKVYRGGLLDYRRARWDLESWMKQDQRSDAYFTTMFDLYALPNDFPRYAEVKKIHDVYQRITRLEEAFAGDLNHSRFIPYIQLHEFEALLFADVRQFDWEFLDHQAAISQLSQIVDEFGNPELIDDGAESAPSKRIIRWIPEYQTSKISAGPLIAEKIGLPKIRQVCKHFDEWLTKLERLVAVGQIQKGSQP